MPPIDLATATPDQIASAANAATQKSSAIAIGPATQSTFLFHLAGEDRTPEQRGWWCKVRNGAFEQDVFLGAPAAGLSAQDLATGLLFLQKIHLTAVGT